MLSEEQVLARALAYEEAADHLLMVWTDDPVEIAEGKRVSVLLNKQAAAWRFRAAGLAGKD